MKRLWAILSVLVLSSCIASYGNVRAELGIVHAGNDYKTPQKSEISGDPVKKTPQKSEISGDPVKKTPQKSEIFGDPVKRAQKHDNDTITKTADSTLSRTEILRNKRAQIRQHIDSTIDTHQRITTDERYVVRPEPQWTFRLKTEGSGAFMHIRSNNDDAGRNDYIITSAYNQNIGLSANYRGFSVSASVNPLKILGKYSDTEFDINHYSNFYGVDFNYSRKRRLHGRSKLFDYSHQQTLSQSRYRQTAIDAYWVCNGRKFSYPAVFNNTWIQRRSAGSVLLTASYYDARLTTNGEISILEQDGLMMKNMKLRFFTLGCGYAYNFVPSSHWLIHLSLQPSFMLWKYACINFMPDTAGRDHHYTMPYSFWNGFGIGRLGFNYAWRKYFIGLNGVVRSYRLGHSHDLSFISTSWKVRLYFGMRM